MKLVTGLLLAAVCASAADTSDWSNIGGIARADEVRVIKSDGKSLRGQFSAVTTDSLVVIAGGASQTIARTDVKRVSTKKKGHRVRNTLIGAGVGTAVGAAIGASAHNDEGFFAIAEEVLIPSGAAVGALIGAVIPTGGWRDVYRVK